MAEQLALIAKGFALGEFTEQDVKADIEAVRKQLIASLSATGPDGGDGESTNPTSKRGTPPPSPGHVTGSATAPDDRTVTLVAAPPVSSAEHVSSVCLAFFLFYRVRGSAPDGSSPRVYRRLGTVGYRL